MLPFLLASLLAATAPAPAEVTMPVTAIPAAKPGTAQALFDAATAAAQAGHCDEAIAGFTTLEGRASVRNAPKVFAVVQLRKGSCLLQHDQLDAAGIDLRDGLETLRADVNAYRADIVEARIGLGRIAYLRYDYAAAREQFEIARAIVTPADRFETSLWLARATMFDNGPAALTYAEDAMATAAATPGTTKLVLSDLQTLHARALLNHGALPAAYTELKKALAAQGGLKLQVNVHDVVTRSDLALAALLNKDTDSAREYLAYTGAGRSGKVPFATAAVMASPACGGSADLRPDDVAIVEFGIRDDGSVSYASPIYTSRLGPGALAFARAVADWSWKPDDAKTLGPLFRAVTRVELRCTRGFKHPSVQALLHHDLYDWLASQHAAAVPETDRAAAAVAPLRSELAKRQAAGDTVKQIPVLVTLGDNPVLSGSERNDMFSQARRLAAAAKAPLAARLYLDVSQPEENGGGRASTTAKYRDRLRALLARPEVAADGHASAALHLLIAEPFYRAPAPADAVSLLQQVTADTRLPAQDPLRINALIRLASLQANTGDLVAARASYQTTGLDAQQCALLDTKPVLQRAAANSSRFPMEAMRWGFEGWVQTEYDIAADGTTTSQRAVIAYPPFVFRDAAVGMAKDFRFQASYRPEGTAGCTAAQQNIAFHIGMRR